MKLKMRVSRAYPDKVQNLEVNTVDKYSNLIPSLDKRS